MKTPTKQPIHNYFRAVRRKTPLLHKDLAVLFDCPNEKVGAYEAGTTRIPPHILIFYIMICKTSLDKIFRRQTVETFSQLKERIPILLNKISQENNGRHQEHRITYLKLFINEMDELYL